MMSMIEISRNKFFLIANLLLILFENMLKQLEEYKKYDIKK